MTVDKELAVSDSSASSLSKPQTRLTLDFRSQSDGSSEFIALKRPKPPLQSLHGCLHLLVSQGVDHGVQHGSDDRVIDGHSCVHGQCGEGPAVDVNTGHEVKSHHQERWYLIFTSLSSQISFTEFRFNYFILTFGSTQILFCSHFLVIGS